MGWEESDLAGLPPRIRRQAQQKLAATKKDLPPELKATKKRGKPEKRLVQDPTVKLCEMLGVKWVHIPPSLRENQDGSFRHFTAYEGNLVLLDLILASDGIRIDLELKAPGNKPTKDQYEAIHHLNGYWADSYETASKAVLYVAGQTGMFSFNSDRKIV